MAVRSTVQSVLALIHTPAKIIHAPMQGSDQITDVVSLYRVHGIPLAAGMGGIWKTGMNFTNILKELIDASTYYWNEAGDVSQLLSSWPSSDDL